MFLNYLKIAWRNFYKHRFYTLINIIGLGMGIACAIVLFLFINYHLSFDTHHPNEKNIYRVVTDLHIPDGSIDYDQGSPLILGKMLTEQNPAVVKEAVFLKKRSFTIAVPEVVPAKQALFYEKENIAFANNELFSVFSFNWIAGNKNNPLDAPNTAVITLGLAKKYFRTDDVVGKTIRLDNKYDITITGVVGDNHNNTDLQADMFISMASVAGMFPDIEKPLFNDFTFISSKNNVFLLLKDGVSISGINENMHLILKKALSDNAYQFHLQPLQEVHFDGRYGGSVSKSLLMVLVLVGIALLLIAVVNFVNIATAQSLGRAKEIGTRKVLGSSKSAIFWQFITETAYVTVAAAIIALVVTRIFLPTLNNWLQLQLAFNMQVVIFLAVLVTVIVLLAGYYPAVVLSRFKPVNALKNITDGNSPSSKISRSVLIVAQNTLAQLLIVCTLIIALQVKYLKSADLGFNQNAIIMVPLQENNASSLSYLRNKLISYPGVKSLTYCYSAPADLTNKGGSIRYDGREWEKFTVNSIIGDENYLTTFGLKLLAGRNFSAVDSTEFIVNQQVLTKLHIKSPGQAIGHKLTAGDFNDKNGVIIGVVNDFNSHPLFAPVEPTLIAAQAGYYRYAAIKIAASRQNEVINIIRNTYRQVFPQYVFSYRFLDQQIADFYQKEEMINRLIKVSTIVAILISCLGMIGLISLITVQRTREIGIRKVLGASVGSIVTLMTGDFIKLVTAAIVISTPLAWWTMHSWLQNFAYYVEVKWWLFALSALIALSIAVVTVSLQAVDAALASPVKSLKNE